MCGINGFNFKDKNLIEKMNQITKHRGPDDDGIFIDSGWSLGHNRLSIIDLSKAGSQPMISDDGKFVIIYNGEIYNFVEIKKELQKIGYKFKSRTDTEVVLCAYQEWGDKCLQKFNGMFALAILDTQTRELFLARDRIGIKPLYYCQKGGKFIFSSEIKSILQHTSETSVNKQAFNFYFRLLYVPAPLTMWQGIYKLPPGHCATVKNGKIQIQRYWSIKDDSVVNNREELKEKIKNLLEDSVGLRLISDKPVGVFLSGGIDSTIITGIASKIHPKIDTFSVGFGKTEEQDKYNADMRIAKRTAKFFGTKHHEFTLEPQNIISNLEKVVYHMDEPISNHVQAVNLLLAKSVSEKVAVVLGGDGGDELFGGYERYYYSHLIDQIQKFVPKFLLNNFVSKNLAHAFGKENALRLLASRPGIERYWAFFAQKEKLIGSFVSREYNDGRSAYSWFGNRHFNKINNKDFTRQFMSVDMATWLPDESLARSDKMSMAWGLEERLPFLDHRLVELADQIPVAYKLGKKGGKIIQIGNGYQGKKILISAMRRYLPDFVLNQPKWGWFSPAAKWLRGPLLPLAREVLSPNYCSGTSDIFDFKFLNNLLDSHIKKRSYGLNTLWTVITFQMWYKQYMDKT